MWQVPADVSALHLDVSSVKIDSWAQNKRCQKGNAY